MRKFLDEAHKRLIRDDCDCEFCEQTAKEKLERQQVRQLMKLYGMLRGSGLDVRFQDVTLHLVADTETKTIEVRTLDSDWIFHIGIKKAAYRSCKKQPIRGQIGQ